MAIDKIIGVVEDSVDNKNAPKEEENSSVFEIQGTRLVKCYGNEPHIVVPEYITDIGEKAFFITARDLHSVVLPQKLRTIGDRAFSDSYNLLDLTIPDTVTEIGEHAFAFSGLLEVTVPGSVSVIRSNTFYYCTKMKKAVLMPGVRVIMGAAFWCCQDLELLVIPDTLEEIHWLRDSSGKKIRDAFDGCKSLWQIRASKNWINTHRDLYDRILASVKRAKER